MCSRQQQDCPAEGMVTVRPALANIGTFNISTIHLEHTSDSCMHHFNNVTFTVLLFAVVKEKAKSERRY